MQVYNCSWECFHSWFSLNELVSLTEGERHKDRVLTRFFSIYDLILLLTAVDSYTQVFIFYSWVVLKVAVLWHRGGKIYRNNEHADLSQPFSVLESQTVKNQSFSCKISTNYEKPRQSVLEVQRIKSCWKSRAASNSSCIFLERDPCLGRTTKIVATEVGQVRQSATLLFR